MTAGRPSTGSSRRMRARRARPDSLFVDAGVRVRFQLRHRAANVGAVVGGRRELQVLLVGGERRLVVVAEDVRSAEAAPGGGELRFVLQRETERVDRRVDTAPLQLPLAALQK